MTLEARASRCASRRAIQKALVKISAARPDPDARAVVEQHETGDRRQRQAEEIERRHEARVGALNAFDWNRCASVPAAPMVAM